MMPEAPVDKAQAESWLLNQIDRGEGQFTTLDLLEGEAEFGAEAMRGVLWSLIRRRIIEVALDSSIRRTDHRVSA